ncbi:hypothetical protein GCM10027346_42210 [Hymenobacter seoulensis]
MIDNGLLQLAFAVAGSLLQAEEFEDIGFFTTSPTGRGCVPAWAASTAVLSVESPVRSYKAE